MDRDRHRLSHRGKLFETAALLALEPGWQKLDKIRILLRDEMTARARQVLLEGLREHTKAILVDFPGADSVENRGYAREKFVGPLALGAPAHEIFTQGRVIPGRASVIADRTTAGG